MRNFFNSHWKVIVAILLAIVLATLTVETRSGTLPLPERLQAHVGALDPASLRSAARHVESSLRRHGYAPEVRRSAGAVHSIEVARANLPPGARPSHTFIVGAHLDGDDRHGVAAVLELAGALEDLRPSPGTEIRFVFFVGEARAASAGQLALLQRRGSGNFMAYIGREGSSQRIGQTLAAFRSDQMLTRQGLAAPAHVMGVTLAGRRGATNEAPAIVITDTGFLRYPYFRAGAGQDEDRADYDAMARVVEGLARTLKALAGPVEA